MVEPPTCCPQHGSPDAQWPCISIDDEVCPHLVEEMERRIAEHAAGNFWRLHWEGEVMVFMEFVDHVATGRTDRYAPGGS